MPSDHVKVAFANMGLWPPDFSIAANILDCEEDDVMNCTHFVGMPVGPDSAGIKPIELSDKTAYPRLRMLPFTSEILAAAASRPHGPTTCECCGGTIRTNLKVNQESFDRSRAACMKQYKLKLAPPPSTQFAWRTEAQQQASSIPQLEDWHRQVPSTTILSEMYQARQGSFDQERFKEYIVFGYVAARPHVTETHTVVLVVQPSCEVIMVGFWHVGKKSMQVRAHALKLAVSCIIALACPAHATTLCTKLRVMASPCCSLLSW